MTEATKRVLVVSPTTIWWTTTRAKRYACLLMGTFIAYTYSHIVIRQYMRDSAYGLKQQLLDAAVNATTTTASTNATTNTATVNPASSTALAAQHNQSTSSSPPRLRKNQRQPQRVVVVRKKNRRLPHTFGEEEALYADLIHEGLTGSYWLPRPPSTPIGGYELREEEETGGGDRESNTTNTTTTTTTTATTSPYGNRTGFVGEHYVTIIMYDGVWFPYESDGFNAGDFIAYFASPLIAGRPALVTGMAQGHKRHLAHGGLAVVGSILHFGPRYVWGPGMIQEPQGPRKPSLLDATEKVFAMRGPKSYRQMKRERPENGTSSSIPAVWGDLGSLMSWFYQPHDVVKKWELCIIPHYVDVHAPFIAKIRTALNESMSVLDIKGPLTSLMNDIVRCEFVLSSSLHGLIFADSYDVPNAHLELSNKVFGKGHKFEDYFESVNRTRHVLNGHDAASVNMTMDTIQSWVAAQKRTYRKRMNLLPFWKACPMHAVAYYNTSRTEQMDFAQSWVETFDKYMHNRPHNMTQLELDMNRDLNISIPMHFDARRR